MNKKILLLVTFLIIIVGIWWFLMGQGDKTKGLVSPQLPKIFNKSTPIPEPTAVPPNAPKTFQFDESTDLEAELEKINPQVLDSDFE
ncbi:hypothetical protein HYS94_05300 [Candidatus Daviesbacteria bacterium]|nr:hypothetical protein [Candidatus Daviesbacteria bacterium]MBI4035433.1 hypothetical protein [Candidatus Daviesbacteria bacterium]